jgi:hypothetical protein
MKNKDRNESKSNPLLVIPYLIWSVVLIFWGVIFHQLLGKKIGFAAGIIAIIFSYLTVHGVSFILKKLRERE